MANVVAIVCGEVQAVRDPADLWEPKDVVEPTNRPWWAFWRPREVTRHIGSLAEQSHDALLRGGGVPPMQQSSHVLTEGPHVGHTHYTFSMERSPAARAKQEDAAQRAAFHRVMRDHAIDFDDLRANGATGVAELKDGVARWVELGAEPHSFVIASGFDEERADATA